MCPTAEAILSNLSSVERHEGVWVKFPKGTFSVNRGEDESGNLYTTTGGEVRVSFHGRGEAFEAVWSLPVDCDKDIFTVVKI
jgi:hypothetical protein